MKLFYMILFCTAGGFNILAAVLDFRWYTNYRMKNKRSRAKARVFIGLAGLLLILYGVAYFVGWI